MAEPSEVFFEAGDYAQRIEKVRQAMAAAEVDLLVTTHPAHVCYLAGHFTQAVTDLMFLALPAQGQPFAAASPVRTSPIRGQRDRR